VITAQRSHSECFFLIPTGTWKSSDSVRNQCQSDIGSRAQQVPFRSIPPAYCAALFQGLNEVVEPFRESVPELQFQHHSRAEDVTRSHAADLQARDGVRCGVYRPVHRDVDGIVARLLVRLPKISDMHRRACNQSEHQFPEAQGSEPIDIGGRGLQGMALNQQSGEEHRGGLLPGAASVLDDHVDAPRLISKMTGDRDWSSSYRSLSLKRFLSPLTVFQNVCRPAESRCRLSTG